MTHQEKVFMSAEQTARKILSESFGQKTTDAQVREVALKLAKIVPPPVRTVRHG